MRGEYGTRRGLRDGVVELPPRARRIHSLNHPRYGFPGTTSACAENTLKRAGLVFLQWNYLRVRGEYIMFENTIIDIMELPPRARRIPSEDSTLLT